MIGCLCLSVSVCLSRFVCVCLPVSVCLFLLACLCLPASVCLPPFVCLCLAVCFSISLSQIYLCIMCMYTWLVIYIYSSTYLRPSLCPSVRLSVCVSLLSGLHSISAICPSVRPSILLSSAL